MRNSNKRQPATLGQRIVQARTAMELSTAQLARRMGVKTVTLAGWESDRSEPRANRLVKLAAMTNVSLGWLLAGKGDGPHAHTIDAEIAHLRTSLLALQSQAESTAVQIKELLVRLDRLQEGTHGDDS